MLAAFRGAGLGLAPRKLWNYFWSPKEIQHPFHPDHTLFLLDKPPYESGSFQCKACGWVFSGSTYHCSECSFDLDPTCASLKPTEKTQQHLSPPHPLIFCELNDEDKNKFEGRTCCSCNQPFKDSCSICVCLHCHCLLDESCANLPLQIQHPFHPQYPLNLLFQPLHQEDKDSIKWHCRACGKKLKGSGGLIYQCCTSTCDSCEGKFGLDVFCASLTPTYELDLSLAHPLTLCETKKNKNSFSCYACQLPFRDSVYVCLECCILLHITCANLPREINDQDCHIHLLTLHPLNLLQSSNRPCPINQFDCCFHCNACKKDTIGFAYTCGECEFYSDIRCIMKSAVLYKRYPLVWLNTTSDKLRCDFCCYHLHTPMLHCTRANFNIHVMCFPILPQIVQTVHHRHKLTFNKSPMKGHRDESDEYHLEYYCDNCEKPRKLAEYTYYCEECRSHNSSFIAHVHCVVSKAMSELVKEWDLDITLPKENADNEASNTLKIQEITERAERIEAIDDEVRLLYLKIYAEEEKKELMKQINAKEEERKEHMVELYGEWYEWPVPDPDPDPAMEEPLDWLILKLMFVLIMSFGLSKLCQLSVHLIFCLIKLIGFCVF